MTQRIRLMAEYGSESLWWDDSEKVGPIDPAALSLSQDTILHLKKWAQQYDSRLNRSDPASSAYFTDAELSKFEEEGILLWQQLREELSSDFEVVYFSERLRKVVSDPNELVS